MTRLDRCPSTSRGAREVSIAWSRPYTYENPLLRRKATFPTPDNSP